MAKIAVKMICPSCGVEMNHHCDKLVYTTDTKNAGPTDPSLGGFIEEFHSLSQVWWWSLSSRLGCFAEQVLRARSTPISPRSGEAFSRKTRLSLVLGL